MKKTEKYRIMSKKIDFWPNLHETSGCHGNVKNDGHTIDMNEQLLKVSAPKSKSSFQNFEKNLIAGMAPIPSSPLVRPRVKGYCFH